MTSLLSQVAAASRFIQSLSPLRPAVAVVLGSGLASLARSVARPTSVSLVQIPHFPVGGVEGHGDDLLLGLWHDVPVAVLSGRPHLYEGFSARELALPVRVLGRLGARAVVLTCAVGSANVNYRPGEIVVIEDHINLTGTSPLAGEHEAELGQRFVDMSGAYDVRLREIAERACLKVGASVRKGVAATFPGPQYETPAEIRMARALGADVVGMSTALEVIAARQAGLRVLALACVTNLAAGVTKKPLTHAEVLTAAKSACAALSDALALILPAVAAEI
jgi:purine-nucleoside phosphorylase